MRSKIKLRPILSVKLIPSEGVKFEKYSLMLVSQLPHLISDLITAVGNQLAVAEHLFDVSHSTQNFKQCKKVSGFPVIILSEGNIGLL